MRILAALLFAIGALLGLLLGLVIAPVSFFRRARAVHADGVVCRARLAIHDPALAALAGPALVRLSGAFEAQGSTRPDVLGLAVRLQRTASDDPRVGDQDLLFGSFTSFATAGRDRASTDVGDYLHNHYSTVTPWWIAGRSFLLTLAPRAQPTTGADRLARLDADLAADRARLALQAGGVDVGELQLLARLAVDDRALRASMFRHGRGLRPLGLRNGIRSTVYPLSQLARRLRGG